MFRQILSTEMRSCVVLLSLALCALSSTNAQEPGSGEGRDDARQREEWFAHSRQMNGKMPSGLRLKALAGLETMRLNEKIKFQKRFGTAAVIQGSAITGMSPQDLGLAGTVAPWTSIGPKPMILGSTAYSGRISAIAIDPSNINVVYAGAAEGGIWKSTDAGSSWQPLTDTQNSLASGSIKLDPANPNIIYVGTGEANSASDAYYGAGLLKSTDAGATWQNIQSPFVTGGTSVRIAALDIYPSNDNVLLAATTRTAGSGIYRSTDAGATWTLVYSGGPTFAVRFLPNSPNTAVAVGFDVNLDQQVILRSTDAGVTWQVIIHASPDFGFGDLTAQGSIALGTGHNTIYAALGGNTAALLYKSTDAGATWTAVNNKTTTGQTMCTSACWYSLTLAVHPTDPNLVYFGAVDLFRSTDGGNNWQSVTDALHVDHHVLTFTPAGDRLYAGNDGGVWSTADPRASSLTWTSLNQDLATLQFYSGISMFPGNPNFGIGGTQDNGTLRYNGNPAWTNILITGDSFQTAIDPTTSSRLFTTTQFGHVWQSSNGGASFTQTSGLPVGNNFFTPLVMDPSNHSRLYTAVSAVLYRTDNGSSWTQASGSMGQQVNNIDVSPSDENTVYVSAGNSVNVTRNAISASTPTYTSHSSPGREVMKVAVDPHDPTVAYAGLGGFSASDGKGNVYKLTNSGSTWTNITSNLVDAPVNDIVVDPDVPNTLYIANDVGVFSSSDGGQTWNSMVNGLPRSVVMGLALDRATRTLRAATHGRSMFDVTLPSIASTCAAPSTTAINICSPANGSTVSSPVHMLASAKVSGTIYRFELWANNVKIASVANSGTMDQNVTLANGSYQLTFVARNTDSSSRVTKTINITVGSSPSCGPPSSNGIVVCSPANGSTVASPVAVKAFAKVSGSIYRFELWEGTTKLASVANSGTMSVSISRAVGSHQWTFVARNTDNSSRFTKTITFTVH
jgi:photosystem II stability/assembly factor-like uncharacterized protein